MHSPVKYGLLETQQDALVVDARHSTRVRERYDRLAPYIALIDHLLLISLFRIRARAIRCLPISAGDTAVELGCGTGRNFPFLRGAVGRDGRVIGVEFSAGMLARAVGSARQEQLDVADLKPWENLARLGPMQMKEFVFGAY